MNRKYFQIIFHSAAMQLTHTVTGKMQQFKSAQWWSPWRTELSLIPGNAKDPRRPWHTPVSEDLQPTEVIRGWNQTAGLPEENLGWEGRSLSGVHVQGRHQDPETWALRFASWWSKEQRTAPNLGLTIRAPGEEGCIWRRKLLLLSFALGTQCS